MSTTVEFETEIPTGHENPAGALIDRLFDEYNAGTTKRAAQSYKALIEEGGGMIVSLGGAMSTAGIGKTLAPMIREGKVHAISCTGANLEEDLFRLVGYNRYEDTSDYRDLTRSDEKELLDDDLQRVTTAAIPTEVMEKVEDAVKAAWERAEAAGERKYPHEFMYEVIRSGALEEFYTEDPKDSWLIAASDLDLPIMVPGWEDSTLGNYFVACVTQKELRSLDTVLAGPWSFAYFMGWYADAAYEYSRMGWFQIGGGISGDAAICVVPCLTLDLGVKQTPLLDYFCQITDATESYGGYSGADPREKITWRKLDKDSEMFVINSDATIVAPLVFSYVLGYLP